MRLIVLLVILALSADASGLGGITKTLMKTFLFRQMSLLCKCNDFFPTCDLFKASCGMGNIKIACPVTCGLCTACPPPEPPSLSPPVVPCDLTCQDVWLTSVCEYYKAEGYCSLYKNQCRSTCEECVQCNLPPNSPIPCSDDCVDIEDERSCLFWNRRGFCEPGEHSNVRYVCQRTCGKCHPCSV